MGRILKLFKIKSIKLLDADFKTSFSVLKQSEVTQFVISSINDVDSNTTLVKIKSAVLNGFGSEKNS